MYDEKHLLSFSKYTVQYITSHTVTVCIEELSKDYQYKTHKVQQVFQFNYTKGIASHLSLTQQGKLHLLV